MTFGMELCDEASHTQTHVRYICDNQTITCSSSKQQKACTKEINAYGHYKSNGDQDFVMVICIHWRDEDQQLNMINTR